MKERETRKKQGTGEGEVSKKLEYVSHPFEPVSYTHLDVYKRQGNGR